MTTNIFLTLHAIIIQAGEGLNPWRLVSEAGWVVKAVMLLLVVASILSWTIILWKSLSLRAAAKVNQKFADDFWKAGSLETASRSLRSATPSPLSRIFELGLQEFNQIQGLDLSRTEKVELLETNLARALSKASSIEAASYQKHLSFLASTASAAPFVGLFGTVWGIMTSFINIGETGASNLAVVAPGIAEALIATALGLFAAIPAVLFYNFFAGRIKAMNLMMNNFGSDLMNLAKRAV